MALTRLSLAAGPALALAALLLTSNPAAAGATRSGYYTYRYGYNPGYYAGSGPSYAPNPYGGTAYSPQVHAPPAPRTASRPAPAGQASGPLGVVVRWPKSRTVNVAIRGPDGKVRTFRVEGGPEVIQVRDYTLRPGERLVINLGGSPPVKVPRK